jgi:nucleoside-diphosphate-sugar epimerase
MEVLETEEQLDERLSRPTPELIEDLARLPGDLVILGVGGKMGPTLARMARRAADEAGDRRHVIGVSRFSEPGLQEELEAAGVETITCDLLDRAAVARLPDAPNVIFMAGRKFGSTGDEARTWAMNAYVPALVAERYRDARIVVFSSGNVYPLVPVASGGATEECPPAPIGEYAQSVLARERVFEYFSRVHGTPMVLLRLNYAIDLRYGVLLDVAQRVAARMPIDLTMGHVNVIWQGDANAIALRALTLCESPPKVLNVTGPETISVRWLASEFGARLGIQPVFEGCEAATALLSNAARCFKYFGYPTVPLAQMIDWVAHWVKIGGPTLSKPTHFEQREGRF